MFIEEGSVKVTATPVQYIPKVLDIAFIIVQDLFHAGQGLVNLELLKYASTHSFHRSFS